MTLRLKSGLLAALLIMASSCVSLERSPITDNRRAFGFSWQQEVQLGREADAQIIEYYGLYDDPELTAYITDIGKRVLSESHMRRETTRQKFRETEFTFRILDSPVVNAFALPGGFNYVTRGLLTHMTSEAQLAMVLGHEIAHVAARHASQQALRQQAGQILLIGTAVLGQELLGIPGQEIIGLGGSAAQLLFLSYSRDAEREADRLGVEYAAKAGYAAGEGAAFFTTLRRISEKAGHSIPSHLSSHPDPGEREVDIVRRAEMWRERGFPQEVVNREQFYAAIDGMIMGENPREGFTRDGIFYHPELAFRFPVPDNWNLINERSEVILVNSSQQAVTIFTISGKSTALETVDEIGNLEQITVVSRDELQINGLPGARITGTMVNQNTTYRVEVTSVEHLQRVYRFLSYAPEAQASQYSPLFRQTATGFQHVTDRSILDIQPARIRIITTDRTAPFASFIPSRIPDGMDPEDLAIINHVELNQSIPSGSLLKMPAY